MMINWLQIVIKLDLKATQPAVYDSSHVFKDWDVRTQDAMQLYWGGKILRSSKLYLAAVVVDHPQLDKFVGGGE
jgi:hypothetical protein